jgi:hypothetical protein
MKFCQSETKVFLVSFKMRKLNDSYASWWSTVDPWRSIWILPPILSEFKKRYPSSMFSITPSRYKTSVASFQLLRIVTKPSTTMKTILFYASAVILCLFIFRNSPLTRFWYSSSQF